MNYYKIYEKLYSIGYHSKQKNHGKRYVWKLANNYEFKTILDVGCSNGVAVYHFKKLGKRAYGLDVSEIAIRYANEKTGARNCLMASATDIPYRDKFFDAVFSCDVLEHLTPDDAKRAIDEIVRVARAYVFIKVDGEPEKNRTWIDEGKVRWPKLFGGIDNLHLTTWPINKWQQEFEARGCRLVDNHDGLMVYELPD